MCALLLSTTKDLVETSAKEVNLTTSLMIDIKGRTTKLTNMEAAKDGGIMVAAEVVEAVGAVEAVDAPDQHTETYTSTF